MNANIIRTYLKSKLVNFNNAYKDEIIEDIVTLFTSDAGQRKQQLKQFVSSEKLKLQRESVEVVSKRDKLSNNINALDNLVKDL